MLVVSEIISVLTLKLNGDQPVLQSTNIYPSHFIVDQCLKVIDSILVY